MKDSTDPSRDARALQHRSAAEGDAGCLPELAGVDPLPIARLLVVEAGTMGSGIAVAALEASGPGFIRGDLQHLLGKES